MTPPFFCAPYIKEIGRGKEGARSLTQTQAMSLFAAILDEQVSDLELGAIMLALRVKGESVAEIIAYLEAARSHVLTLHSPTNHLPPVLLPTYNGARHAPNLVPLLAGLLAREGVPVLVHGLQHFSGRVTTYEIWHQLGWLMTENKDQLHHAWVQGKPAFMTIDALSPRLADLLRLRDLLGVRNATHTLVKMLQPFDCPALRMVSYTHPEYHALQTEVLSQTSAHALLLRGTEGEAVANPKRQPEIEWFRQGVRQVLLPADFTPLANVPALPKSRAAEVTAAWINEALAGRQPIPEVIVKQVEHTLYALKCMQ